MYRNLSVLLALGVFAGAAPAAQKTIDFTLTAGDHARANEPVTVALALPPGFEKIATVQLTEGGRPYAIGQFTAPGLDAAGQELPGSVGRELHFILPSLKAARRCR